jgi:putative DNA primase/helicase
LLRASAFLRLPGLSAKGDPYDWVQEGGTADQLSELVETDAVDVSGDNALTVQRTSGYSLISRRASEIEPERVQWLWLGRIARGKHTIVAGEPGTGKSQLSIAIAAAITTGGEWPCGEGRAPFGSVIILSAEDGAADTIVPRLIAAGADLRRIHIISAVGSANGHKGFDFKADIGLLEQKIVEIGDVALVVVDPISSYMGKTDSHKNADVRGVLEPIAEMADRTRVAILTVTHFSKPNGGAAPKILHKFIGSIAFGAQARAAFAVLEDPKDRDRRLFLHTKNNLAESAQGLAFRLEQVSVEDGIATSRVDWEPEPIATTADEALSDDRKSNLAAAEAEEFLQTLLADGPVPSKQIDAEAQEAGIAKQTLRRAKAKLGVKAVKGGMKEGWVWTLPKAPNSDEDAHLKNVSTFGTDEHLR